MQNILSIIIKQHDDFYYIDFAGDNFKHPILIRNSIHYIRDYHDIPSEDFDPCLKGLNQIKSQNAYPAFSNIEEAQIFLDKLLNVILINKLIEKKDLRPPWYYKNDDFLPVLFNALTVDNQKYLMDYVNTFNKIKTDNLNYTLRTLTDNFIKKHFEISCGAMHCAMIRNGFSFRQHPFRNDIVYNLSGKSKLLKADS